MNIFRKFFSLIFLICSLILLFYTFYKSEIYWEGNNNYYQIYYIISFTLILVSTISFFFNKKVKDYFIISTLSIVVGFYIFEVYLIIKKPIIKKINYKQHIKKELIFKKETGKEFDKRSPLKIYDEYKRNNIEVSIKIPQALISENEENFFSLAGMSKIKTIFCNENGYMSDYISDRYGFNNPDNEWNKKETEYLLIGDSFAHGACVNRPYDIASILRDLSKKNVLNLGYIGNGPLREYATLREYLKPNVKNILWVYYEGNDLLELNDEIKNKILINYIKNFSYKQNLKLKQEVIDKFAEKFISEERQKIKKKDNEKIILKIINFLKIYETRYLFLKNQSKPLKEFKEILVQTKKLSNLNESRLYFIYLPTYERYSKNLDNKDYESIKKIVNELNIPFIDIHQLVFKNEKNPKSLFPFQLYGHYNTLGYKKVAETIYKITKSN